MPARPIPSASPSFLHSDRRLARVAQPLVRFLDIEAAGGIALVAAAAAALIWANAWPGSYESVWSTEGHIEGGNYVFAEDLQHGVNELLISCDSTRTMRCQACCSSSRSARLWSAKTSSW